MDEIEETTLSEQSLMQKGKYWMISRLQSTYSNHIYIEKNVE